VIESPRRASAAWAASGPSSLAGLLTDGRNCVYRGQIGYENAFLTMDTIRLSAREKIGYGLGDAASHIVFDNVMFYMPFSTRMFLVSRRRLSGPCFFLARGLDAVSDPIMGGWRTAPAPAGADSARISCGGGALRAELCAGLQHPEPGTNRQDGFRGGHVHAAHPDVHRRQHPLLRFGRCHHGRRHAAHFSAVYRLCSPRGAACSARS